MDARVVALAEILRLNTRLFRNCLDGMTDEQARRRPSATTNHAAFIAAHLTDARFYLLRILGAEHPNPLAYLADARGIDDLENWPPLGETVVAWRTAAHALRDRLAAITASDLDAPVTTRFPMANATVLAALTFLVQHDSYHLGQLALLRKYVGLSPMGYG